MTDTPHLDALRPKERTFVEGVVIHGKGAQAARDAGWAAKSSHVTASKLLRKPNIQSALAEARAEAWKRQHMTQDELLALLGSQARLDLSAVVHVTPDGEPYIDLAKAPPGFMQHVTEVSIEDFTDGREVDEQGETIKRDVRRVKIKTLSQDAARDKLMKHFGAYQTKIEISADGDFATKMAAAFARSSKGADNGTE